MKLILSLFVICCLLSCSKCHLIIDVLVAKTSKSGTSVPVSINKGVVIGNSTVAAYLEQNSVASYVYNSRELESGYYINSVAHPGDNINEQKANWDTITKKTQYGWVIVEIGLNDMVPGEDYITALNRYQSLINKIKSDAPQAKIILSTMTPAHGRWTDLYKTKGEIAQSKWEAMNEAIKGNGSHAITGVDYRVSSHTSALADEGWHLKQKYEVDSVNDHIHENNAARQIIAAAWRDALIALELL